MGLLSLRGNEVTVAISYFVENLLGLLRYEGVLPNKRTNGGLLLSLLKDKYRVKRHACSQ